MKKTFAITSVLAMAAISFAGQDAATSGKMDSKMEGKMAGKMAGKLPAADAHFAMMVAQTDIAELQVSNMALQKSSSDDVKKLAQKLIDDHTKTSDAMKQIAQNKGMTLPTDADAKHKALAKKLDSESGATFDKDFLNANSMDHHKVVAAFKKESTSGADPDVKEFATKFLPAIQEHTEMIDKSKSSM